MGTSPSRLRITEPRRTASQRQHYSEISQTLSKALLCAADSKAALLKLAARLARTAETAYSARYMDLVEQAALMLLNLPAAEAHNAGAFYQALCLNHAGLVDEANAVLRWLADSGLLGYRSRAIQALGAICCQQNRLDEALRYQIEAANAARGHDLLSILFAHIQVSGIRSAQGDHRTALADLDKLTPIVTAVGGQYPVYLHRFQNERAVELNALGRTDEAKHALNLALASQFAASYPEWQETRQEIEAEAGRNCNPPSPLVVVPNSFTPALARAPSRRITAKTSAIRLSPPVHSDAVCTEWMTANCSRISPILGRYITSARTRGPP